MSEKEPGGTIGKIIRNQGEARRFPDLEARIADLEAAVAILACWPTTLGRSLQEGRVISRIIQNTEDRLDSTSAKE